MDTAPGHVYLLLLTRSRDARNRRWSSDNAPPDVGVFSDAWTAIDAARAKLGDVEKVDLEPEDHAAGVVWIGRMESMEAVVRRHIVWPTVPLTG